ncbi:glycosyl transferase [Desulfocurvibacter africanus PCS]|uniref:Glycosyl transferase n=2 Tax=Desulfocurvibacter africanus TaxID=873 RepID=M5PQW2_DESAF|nr:glycosyl transferase [Desulfocurvibacter africanus PCS]
MISVLILTLDEEANLPACLDSVRFSDDLHVLDSGSSDRTADIARARGARVTQRPMDDWASQLNFAMRELPFRHPWVFMIDADERASPDLVQAMLKAVGVSRPAERFAESEAHLSPLQFANKHRGSRGASAPGGWGLGRAKPFPIPERDAQPTGDIAAFSIRRRDFFLDGRELRRVQATPRYVRLFRPERVSFSRLVNPVTHVHGPVGRLDGDLLHYPFSKGLAQWIARHNSYSTLEARQELEQEARDGSRISLRGLLHPDLGERRRQQKLLLARLPMRSLARFLALYAARGGFLDGRAGLAYALLQAWYEYMIVLKKREMLAFAKRRGE